MVFFYRKNTQNNKKERKTDSTTFVEWKLFIYKWDKNEKKKWIRKVSNEST